VKDAKGKALVRKDAAGPRCERWLLSEKAKYRARARARERRDRKLVHLAGSACLLCKFPPLDGFVGNIYLFHVTCRSLFFQAEAETVGSVDTIKRKVPFLHDGIWHDTIVLQKSTRGGRPKNPDSFKKAAL